MRSVLSVSAAAALCGLAVSSARAGVPDGDVYMTWDGSRIGIGLIPEGGGPGDAVPGVRVFAGDIGDPDPFTANDPGLMGVAGTFPVPSSVGFHLTAPVRTWNGSEFSAAPSGDYFRVYLGALQAATPGNPLALPDGWSIAVDGPGPTAGEWHHHPFWELDSESPSTPDGLFLVEMTVYNSTTNIPSDPFWIIWNKEADPDNPVNDVGAAYDWVNANLVPAPASAAFLGAGFFAARRRRRSPA